MKKLIVKNIDGDLIDETQGEDAELQVWLDGNVAAGKYAEGFTTEFQDVTEQFESRKKISDRGEVRAKCLVVLDKIGAANDAGGASDVQMDAFFSEPEMISVILALVTGAPGTAKRKIQAIGPAVYSQTFVDEIVADLAALEA